MHDRKLTGRGVSEPLWKGLARCTAFEVLRAVVEVVAIAAVLLLLATHPAQAQSSGNYECAADLNGDGSIDQSSEVQQCYNSTTTTTVTGSNCAAVTEACNATTTTPPTCPTVQRMCHKDTDGEYLCPMHPDTSCYVADEGEHYCDVPQTSCTTTSYACPDSPGTACSSNSAGVQSCTYTPSTCSTTSTTTGYLCPLQAQACNQATDGSYSCPLGSQYACLANASGSVMCSVHPCTDTTGSGVVVNPPVNDPTPTSNAPTDPTTGACLANLRIFPGRDATCKGNGVETGFQDCCKASGSMNDTMGGPQDQSNQRSALQKGLSTAFPFYPQCSSGDTQTGYQRNSGYCHYVGDYCGESWPLVGCVQTVHAYCCYGSMLSRIIQEAGHAQISEMGGWGTPTSPNCRGFTPAEFQSIDFSKVDLSEYYNELQYSTQSQVQSQVNTSAIPQ